MKLSLKKKWVEALRSKDYAQGMGYLRCAPDDDSPDQFCCLGVLCDVVDPDVWTRVDRVGAPYMHDGISVSMLNEDTRKRLGLLDKAQIRLIEMNDSGKSFGAIATWIEENVK